MKKCRNKAILQLTFILLALVVIYLNCGAPPITRGLADRADITRNLAQNMEIMQEIPVPDGSGKWPIEAQEKIYLLRYEDTVGAILTNKHHVGTDYYIGLSGEMIPYESRDGMAIVPLYGLEEVDNLFTKLLLAVVPTNPNIKSIDLVAYDKDGNSTIYPTVEAYSGIFQAACAPTFEHSQFTIYDSYTAIKSYGAIGYDAHGQIIAQALPLP